ncbi:RagB/SusD family nutrient uptake outer membrane protein [Hymenobacter cellulosivorans]|uniref:RagB/SusD family nutrient uptake outer membrane protein n=1 Tax=Hymenobacter cellulosivorans TaxID=2932249 RepID=A0ABY4F309_9BACT|nr:RagB/SusD family nutrient uptake outer membrane protein [Hymenobacter cellulosivorans]UOQ50940.1 RagB/SusD family nutrient uptake outer membrane protein [Hymenobacter cellulosivorans]
MKVNKIAALLLVGGLFMTTACDKDLLDQANPNAPTKENFWQNQEDATKGIYACYSGLQQFACYYRSWHFMAHRSDESFSQSPFVELADFTRFIQPNVDFFISSFAWNDYYRTIYRTNQAIGRIPGIQMDEKLRRQLVAEARFVRALSYFDLTYFFGNIPLILEEPVDVNYRAPQVGQAQLEAQMIVDLQAAIPDLPLSYNDAEKGRATKGAAQALLAKVYMQQRKWAEASALFAQIQASGQYGLVPNYVDNFTDNNENNRESVFEVQFSGAVLEVGQGQDNGSSAETHDRPNFFGPPGPTYADVQPRRWLLDAYTDSTVSLAPGSKTKHQIDPRRDVSIIHVDNPDRFYGQTFAEWGWNPNQQYWRKYLNDRTRTAPGQRNENFSSGINHRVIRYADVLLMQAEAQTELKQFGPALTLVNQVRARVDLAPLTGSYSEEQLRQLIRLERARELAGEGTRWFDILRWGLMDNPAGLEELKGRDPDFTNFRPGISKLLPIPRRDLGIDPALRQNTGY